MYLQKKMHGGHQTKKAKADKHDSAHRAIELRGNGHKLVKIGTSECRDAVTGSENLSNMVTAMQPIPSTDMQLK